MKQEEQRAIVGKAMTDMDVLNAAMVAVKNGELQITDLVASQAFDATCDVREQGCFDVLNLVEYMEAIGIKEPIRMVRTMLDEANKYTTDDIMLMIQCDSETQELKRLNNELLAQTAKCIAERKIKSIVVGRKNKNSYMVRLKGGLSVLMNENGDSPIVYLQAGNSLDRFPVSYALLDEIYHEMHSPIEDEQKHEPESEPSKEPSSAKETEAAAPTSKPRGFFDRFLK